MLPVKEMGKECSEAMVHQMEKERKINERNLKRNYEIIYLKAVTSFILIDVELSSLRSGKTCGASVESTAVTVIP